MNIAASLGSTRVLTSLGQVHVDVVGNGPPAVLWHSMFVDSASWQRVIPQLAAQRTLLVVDGPSAGRSDPLTRTSTIGECAEVAAELLTAVGVDGSVDWVGNAWGGHVGIHLSAERPDLVRTLVAIGAPTQPLERDRRRTVRMLKPMYRLIGARGPVASGLLDALLTDATRRTDPEAVQIVLGAFRRADRSGMTRAMQSFVLDRTELGDRARRIGAPVLFIVTDDRGEWTPAQAEAVAATMPDCRVVTLSGARALPNLETPGAVVEAITEFWRSRD